MWRDSPTLSNLPHPEKEFSVHSDKCGKMFNKVYPGSSICEFCRKVDVSIMICCKVCNYRRRMCLQCYSNLPLGKEEKRGIRTSECDGHAQSDSFLSTKTIGCIVAFLVIPVLLCLYNPWSWRSVKSSDQLLEKLKNHYPLQKKETWYHVLSVLETGTPTVKTITLLHGEDRRTMDCLVRNLVFLYNDGEHLSEDVTFKAVTGSDRDYGEVLEHYRPIVRKSRILVTDLNEVAGSIARIFHTLCDEGSSDIKPSLFIFTLRCNNRTENLKPIQRATSILRESWKDLAENEISPLLSRIVKNVVEVVPERNTGCTTIK